VLAAYTQLRLAREIAGDQRLPWERPRPQPRLSPYRVRRGFPRLLCATGLASCHAETRRALPRPAQGPLLRPCRASPSDQEARQEAQEEATHGRRGRLTSPAPSTTADLGGRPARHARRVKSQAKASRFRQATGQEAKGLQANPRWAAPGGGDFHLSAGSPAIDSADSSAAGETTTDAVNSARFLGQMSCQLDHAAAAACAA
jgi:hypothetical protein